MFSSVRSVHLMASLAGILLMTLWERLQETKLVFCINMKIASGTCCSWQSDKSRLLFSLASSHLCTTFTTPFPIIFTHLMGDGLLQLEDSSHGLQGSAPVHPAGLADVLQHHLAPTLGLVLHQGHPMVVHNTGGPLEEAGKSWQSLVYSVEVVGQGNIDIAGVELHVDLLVDQSLALLMVVLADLLLGHCKGRRREDGDWRGLGSGVGCKAVPC